MSDTSQNKTEKATAKRKRDARNKGQIPRSKETVNFAVLLTVSAILIGSSELIYIQIKKILQNEIYLKREEIYNINFLFDKIHSDLISVFFILLPIFLGSILSVYIGNIVLGGNAFSLEKLKPKLKNLSPSNALKRWFSIRGVSDLLQSVLKCIVTGVILVSILKGIYPSLIQLSLLPLPDAMSKSAHYLLTTFLTLSFSTFIYALIDYPYQVYQNLKQLRMTKQEVKDEFKESEGNPFIKRKMRLQQRRATKKMRRVGDVAKADLVITNPTHYSVALKYDDETMDAPVILGMGSNLMALHIRRVCTEKKIPILEIPLLARALYHYGEAGERIPEGLFYAVAKVIAYVYRLDDPLSFHLEKEWVDQLPIPEEFNTD